MSTQGHSIRVGKPELYAEEQAEGSPALVFIHYWGGSRRTWSEVTAWLSNRFRCIAVDLRGWGKEDPHAASVSRTEAGLEVRRGSTPQTQEQRRFAPASNETTPLCPRS
jgi:pimeloyl-ACP methyl ester carboxylesterase